MEVSNLIDPKVEKFERFNPYFKHLCQCTLIATRSLHSIKYVNVLSSHVKVVGLLKRSDSDVMAIK